MFLRQLTVSNFKNYENQKIAFDTQIVSLTGKNGMGKTNLLDAIYYLSFTRSAINSSDQQNIRYGESFFLTKGEIDRNGKVHKLQCSYEVNGGKKFLVDRKPLDKLSLHIGEFPIVMVSPNDTDLVREWSELRRKFFDGLLCQIDREYLNSLIRYNHYLKQRNALLKSGSRNQLPDPHLLDKYDLELVSSGKLLWSKRKEFLKTFTPVFLKRYHDLAGTESVSIKYICDYDRKDPELGLKECRKKDILMQRTTFGIHRDDFEFLLGENALKKCGSQGQQKSFVIALRIAQYEVIKESKGFKPILLLDDIFDKLDDVRIGQLTDMIGAGNFGQIFITDARPERTSTLVNQLDEKVQIFKVENGKVVSQSIVSQST